MIPSREFDGNPISESRQNFARQTHPQTRCRDPLLQWRPSGHLLGLGSGLCDCGEYGAATRNFIPKRRAANLSRCPSGSRAACPSGRLVARGRSLTGAIPMSTARSASGRLNAPASATRRPSHRPGAAPISAGIEGSLTAGGYLCELTIAPSVPRRFVLRAAPRCWLTGLSFIPEGAGRHRGHREWQHRPPLCGSPCRTREPSRRPRNRRQ